MIHAIAMLGLVLGITIESGLLAAVSVSIYILSFAIGNGSTLFVYLSEILPASGIGIALSCQWVTSSFIGIGTPILSDAFGIRTVFLMCAAFIFIDVIVLNCLGSESLGKSQQEIDEAFLGTSKISSLEAKK
jgi:hypothetical protein